jgi:hypothetical protein
MLFSPQPSDAGLIPLLAQEIAVQTERRHLQPDQPAGVDDSHFINPGRWDRR